MKSTRFFAALLAATFATPFLVAQDTTVIAPEVAPPADGVVVVEENIVPETSMAQGHITAVDRTGGTISLKTQTDAVPIVYSGAPAAKFKNLKGERKTFAEIDIAPNQYAIVRYGTVNPQESGNPVPVLTEVELMPEPKTATKELPVEVVPVVPMETASPTPASAPTTNPTTLLPGRSETARDALLDGDPTTTSDENADIDGDITTNPD